jgi:hypothetical protein
MVNADFTIESFQQRKHEFRTDKGKKHIYPKQRKRWNLIRHGRLVRSRLGLLH